MREKKGKDNLGSNQCLLPKTFEIRGQAATGKIPICSNAPKRAEAL